MAKNSKEEQECPLTRLGKQRTWLMCRLPLWQLTTLDSEPKHHIPWRMKTQSKDFHKSREEQHQTSQKIVLKQRWSTRKQRNWQGKFHQVVVPCWAFDIEWTSGERHKEQTRKSTDPIDQDSTGTARWQQKSHSERKSRLQRIVPCQSVFPRQMQQRMKQMSRQGRVSIQNHDDQEFERKRTASKNWRKWDIHRRRLRRWCSTSHVS